MHTHLKPLLSILVFAGFCSAAQSAYLGRVDYLGSGGYSATTGASSFNDSAADLSPIAGDVTLFGANSFVSTLTNGSLSHSYAADAFLMFSTASTDLSMSLSHSLGATATGALAVASHQQNAFIDLSSVTLKILGQGSEVDGLAVNVSFSGNASALYDVSNLANSGFLGLGLSVSRGNTVLGEYLWDVQSSGVQAVNLSFNGVVGEELTFSSYMLAGADLTNANFAQNATPYALVEAGAFLNGSFTVAVAAVPEPESYLLFLAGLGLLGATVRSKKPRQ